MVASSLCSVNMCLLRAGHSAASHRNAASWKCRRAFHYSTTLPVRMASKFPSFLIKFQALALCYQRSLLFLRTGWIQCHLLLRETVWPKMILTWMKCRWPMKDCAWSGWHTGNFANLQSWVGTNWLIDWVIQQAACQLRGATGGDKCLPVSCSFIKCIYGYGYQMLFWYNFYRRLVWLFLCKMLFQSSIFE